MSEVLTYFSSGIVQSRFIYVNGKLSGRQEIYFPSGLLRRQIEYVDGLRHGIDVAWDFYGRLLFCEKWNTGKKEKVLAEDLTC